MSKALSAREEILAAVRSAVASFSDSPLGPLPDSMRFEPRTAAGSEEEMELLLSEVRKLSGHGQVIRGRDEFAAALEKLVEAEAIHSAALSDHPLYLKYGPVDLLRRLGVEILSADGGGRRLAECDLGIAVADAALPETGTVLFRTMQGQPDALSLLPRVNLALAAPEALQADIHHALAMAKGDRHFVLVSGSSRTADIEKVLTLGVHGPKSFHLWICTE